ncbi:MAG: hypothetical protein K2Y27_13680 [Xanthobacteraceae bacterium]|nr:hypothetical protein [Xanthobacteraceae bacterium]
MGIKEDRNTVLWALVVAVYQLERLNDESATGELANMRRLLADFSPEKISRSFLKAALAFDPPDTLEQARALYEHYGIEPEGLEKMYPARKPQ